MGWASKQKNTTTKKQYLYYKQYQARRDIIEERKGKEELEAAAKLAKAETTVEGEENKAGKNADDVAGGEAVYKASKDEHQDQLAKNGARTHDAKKVSICKPMEKAFTAEITGTSKDTKKTVSN